MTVTTSVRPLIANKSQLANLVNQITGWHAECQKLKKDALEMELSIGQSLLKAKSLIGRGNGFREWVEQNFSFSIRTAYHRMSAARGFGGTSVDSATVAKFELQAMALLTEAGPKVLKSALREANNLGAGEFTQKRAKEFIKKIRRGGSPDSMSSQSEGESSDAGNDLATNRAKVLAALKALHPSDSPRELHERVENAYLELETIEVVAESLGVELPYDLRLAQ